MIEVDEIQSWLFQIEPLPGESLSHFLGRFRRSNDLTPGGLASAAGFGGAIISRWEKFRFNPPPSPSQLATLAVVVGGCLVSAVFYAFWRNARVAEIYRPRNLR
jgi:hypothetical protein